MLPLEVASFLRCVVVPLWLIESEYNDDDMMVRRNNDKQPESLHLTLASAGVMIRQIDDQTQAVLKALPFGRFDSGGFP